MTSTDLEIFGEPSCVTERHDQLDRMLYLLASQIETAVETASRLQAYAQLADRQILTERLRRDEVVLTQLMVHYWDRLKPVATEDRPSEATQ